MTATLYRSALSPPLWKMRMNGKQQEWNCGRILRLLFRISGTLDYRGSLLIVIGGEAGEGFVILEK